MPVVLVKKVLGNCFLIAKTFRVDMCGECNRPDVPAAMSVRIPDVQAGRWRKANAIGGQRI